MDSALETRANAEVEADPSTEAPESGVSATPAQQTAIDSRAGDVVVSAGAGSGKTFVLVERFKGLVREGVAPERILTITFTERAALEMKERIGKALEKEGYPDARRVAEGAWISTIHGFCARLLRERALEAGVDPAFSVLTDVPASRVRRAAFVRAQEAFRAQRPDLYHGLVERVRWGKNQDGASGIRRRVFQLYDQIRAAGAGLGTSGRLETALDALTVPRVRTSLEQLAEAVRWLTSSMATARRTSFLNRRGHTIADLAARIAAAPIDVFRVEVHRDLRALATATTGGGALAAEFAAVHEAALVAAGAYAEGPARALGHGLEDLLRRFDDAFRELKAEQSALDFTDLEERARELLEARVDVREATQRRFLAVLVDEFQDTSELQQRIVNLVRREGGLFAVGDVKQSIYGFRHANVRGLLDLEARARDGAGEAVALDVSFRTRPEILAFVDDVFGRLWSEAGSEVPHQPLRAGVGFEASQRPCVELVVGRGDRMNRARAHEARAVAARLATLIEGRQLQGTNPLREETFAQDLRYRDCAILVPATTAVPAYERALRERGVPYRVASGRGFYEAREVVDAVHLLRVAGAAYDDLALLAVLRSPSVGLSDGALLSLSQAKGKRPLHEVLGLREVLEALEPGDASRVTDARHMIDTLRSMRGRSSTREILSRALELSGLLDGSLLRSGDVRGYANLQKLLAVVDDLERAGVTGPADIADVIDDLRASDARESEANVAAEDEDAVSILTVHGSKGLEWPLVVVADLGRYTRPGGDPILWSAETGVTLNLRDPDDQEAMTPTSLSQLWERGRARAREESKRLLYVGLTRARDHLVLAGAQTFRARGGGDWLVWCRAALPARQRPIGGEQDLAAGGMARAFVTDSGVVVRSLEIQEDVDGTPIEGVRGPAAGARPVLDARGCHDLANYRLPALPTPSPEDQERAKTLLARIRDPGLPPHDQGSSIYTVSEILTWRACPRRALFEYVVGDQGPLVVEGEMGGGPDRSGVPADVRGTLVHEVLARMIPKVAPVRPTLRGAKGRLEQLLLPRTAAPRSIEDAARRAMHLAKRFAGSPLGRRGTECAETEVEFPFLVALDLGETDPTLLRGTVDLLVPGERGWILADYKSSEITALEVPGKLAEHELQLQLYALALRSMGLEIEEAVVVYLAPEVISTVDITASALERAQELVSRFAAARRELDLPPTPGRACRFCPWSAVCPASNSLAGFSDGHEFPLACARA